MIFILFYFILLLFFLTFCGTYGCFKYNCHTFLPLDYYTAYTDLNLSPISFSDMLSIFSGESSDRFHIHINNEFLFIRSAMLQCLPFLSCNCHDLEVRSSSTGFCQTWGA